MRTLEQDGTGIRTVSGFVSGAGVITSGIGFVVTKTGTGAYTIRFYPGFRSYLSMVASLNNGGFFVASWTQGGDVLVSTYSAGASPVQVDMGFYFTLRGLAR